MTDWPFWECIEEKNRDEVVERIKKLGLVKCDWKPPEVKGGRMDNCYSCGRKIKGKPYIIKITSEGNLYPSDKTFCKNCYEACEVRWQQSLSQNRDVR